MAPFKVVRCRFFDSEGKPHYPFCSEGSHCTFLHPHDSGWPGASPKRLEIRSPLKRRRSMSPSVSKRHISSSKRASLAPDWLLSSSNRTSRRRHRDTDNPESYLLQESNRNWNQPEKLRRQSMDSESPEDSDSLLTTVMSTIFHDIAKMTNSITAAQAAHDTESHRVQTFLQVIEELSQTTSSANTIAVVNSAFDKVKKNAELLKDRLHSNLEELHTLWEEVGIELTLAIEAKVDSLVKERMQKNGGDINGEKTEGRQIKRLPKMTPAVGFDIEGVIARILKVEDENKDMRNSLGDFQQELNSFKNHFSQPSDSRDRKRSRTTFEDDSSSKTKDVKRRNEDNNRELQLLLSKCRQLEGQVAQMVHRELETQKRYKVLDEEHQELKKIVNDHNLRFPVLDEIMRMHIDAQDREEYQKSSPADSYGPSHRSGVWTTSSEHRINTDLPLRGIETRYGKRMHDSEHVSHPGPPIVLSRSPQLYKKPNHDR